MPDIVDVGATVNAVALDLEALADRIRNECAAADKAGCAQIEHAIQAGRCLLQVREQINGSFRKWLEQHSLGRSRAYNFIQLAENETRVRKYAKLLAEHASVHSCGHISTVAMLRMLRAKPLGSKFGKAKGVSGKPLKKADWTCIDAR